MHNIWKKISIFIIAILILAAGALIVNMYFKGESYTIAVRLKNKVLASKTKTYYQDNRLLEKGQYEDYIGDVQLVETTRNSTTYTNYPAGYSLWFPSKVDFDFSMSAFIIKGSMESGNIPFTITREYSPYDDVVKYVADYPNRYLLDPKFISENNIILHKNDIEQIGIHKVQTIIFSRQAAETCIVKNNTYAHCYIYTDSKSFYRLTFSTEEYSDDFAENIRSILISFDDNMKAQGKGDVYQTFKPEIPDNWNEETKTTYENIVKNEKLSWGIFRPQAVRDNALYKVSDVEQKIEHQFSTVLDYLYFGEPFPMDGMRSAYDQGKLVELTMQVSTVMHTNLNGYNPFFEVLDGKRDDYIREFARNIKEFGHPFLFRLNNEMNSDWTSYGGAAILNEPELFKSVWIHIYEIFEEEGVDNAIWIFNPNDRNAPPNDYNHFLNYYPGDKYVQMFGITGYNTGTYYSEVFGEQWRDFKKIYDSVYNNCYLYFSEFPWIITEFSSSSVGGDKPQWISNMFNNIGNYPNLKIAVWFCSVDKDFRQGREEIISRPYLLDENEECVAAFKQGLYNSNYNMQSFFNK